ncbi:helix-turn-helix transcriptional regulator [Planomicrobium sp. Y74]|uniref:helix-turn-helix domain-containing protein n=1 Tax=Planomicrobium sp. Y74 TaxID=2478977 RepID=UPI000EF4A25B|nr:helix-turn-helix transcriptional regulator [Planomicrobium sp. Y74]RLQ84884.1 XRE family transcriptional regulator [Planomicrobium sp. Y74]
MKTNEAVIGKVKIWLQENGKSHQWLAEELNISKALVGHMLSGNRTIQPKRIPELAKILGLSVKELTQDSSIQSKRLVVQLRGATSNRRSKQEVEELLFAIEDYLGLKSG